MEPAYTNEKKEYNDLTAAMEQLEDEVGGIAAYKHMSDHAVCPELKALATKHLVGEREHAQSLAAWIHAYIGKMSM